MVELLALAVHLVVLLLPVHPGAVPADEGDVVELPLVPVLAVERLDLAGVVEERVLVPQRRVELELEREVRQCVPVVVDEDRVEDVVAELEEVRSAGRPLEGHEVAQDRDRRRVVRADERVDVGVVGDRVLADARGFAMGGHLAHFLPGGAHEAPHERAVAVRVLGGAGGDSHFATLGVADVRDDRLLGYSGRRVYVLGALFADPRARDRGRRGKCCRAGGCAGDLHKRAPTKAFHVSAPSRRLVAAVSCGRG